VFDGEVDDYCDLHGLGLDSHGSPEPCCGAPVNLGDTSFLDGIGGPGLLVEEIGDGSHSGKVDDSAGQRIAGAPAINSLGGLTHIAWLSNRRMIGAWYGVEVVGVAAHVNAGDSGTAAGWGDTTMSPFILQWSEQKVGNVRIDQRVVMDFDLPTGEYQRNSNVNLSSHAFTVHPYYAITLFPRKNLETSWRIHYLWNGTNNAPGPGGIDSYVLAQKGELGSMLNTVGQSLTNHFQHAAVDNTRLHIPLLFGKSSNDGSTPSRSRV
jgi:hypothetical protein